MPAEATVRPPLMILTDGAHPICHEAPGTETRRWRRSRLPGPMPDVAPAFADVPRVVRRAHRAFERARAWLDENFFRDALPASRAGPLKWMIAIVAGFVLVGVQLLRLRSSAPLNSSATARPSPHALGRRSPNGSRPRAACSAASNSASWRARRPTSRGGARACRTAPTIGSPSHSGSASAGRSRVHGQPTQPLKREETPQRLRPAAIRSRGAAAVHPRGDRRSRGRAGFVVRATDRVRR
jgi:hypothetical protein